MSKFEKNTGLNPLLSVLHRNCEDLNTMNTCLIGYLDEELTAVDFCDIKAFLHDFLVNQKLMNQALICSDCGQWDQIDKLWLETQKLWNEVNKLWEQTTLLWNEVKKLWTQNEQILNEIQKLWQQNETLLSEIKKLWSQTNQTQSALMKIIQKLEEINVWQGGLSGGFVSGKGIAGGNINLFGGTPDGSYYIRTNKQATENDLAGGLSSVAVKQLKEELKAELKEELKEGE